METNINTIREKIYTSIKEFKRLFKLNKKIVKNACKSKNMFVIYERILNRNYEINETNEIDSDDSIDEDEVFHKEIDSDDIVMIAMMKMKFLIMKQLNNLV